MGRKGNWMIPLQRSQSVRGKGRQATAREQNHKQLAELPGCTQSPGQGITHVQIVWWPRGGENVGGGRQEEAECGPGQV